MFRHASTLQIDATISDTISDTSARDATNALSTDWQENLALRETDARPINLLRNSKEFPHAARIKRVA